jgi:hypothetical protein
MAHSGADAGDFVGGNADADAGAADENAARSFSALERQAQQLRVIRIVVLRVRLVSAEIDHLVAGLSEISADLLLERKAGVVGTDK